MQDMTTPKTVWMHQTMDQSTPITAARIAQLNREDCEQQNRISTDDSVFSSNLNNDLHPAAPPPSTNVNQTHETAKLQQANGTAEILRPPEDLDVSASLLPEAVAKVAKAPSGGGKMAAAWRKTLAVLGLNGNLERVATVQVVLAVVLFIVGILLFAESLKRWSCYYGCFFVSGGVTAVLAGLCCGVTGGLGVAASRNTVTRCMATGYFAMCIVNSVFMATCVALLLYRLLWYTMHSHEYVMVVFAIIGELASFLALVNSIYATFRYRCNCAGCCACCCPTLPMDQQQVYVGPPPVYPPTWMMPEGTVQLIHTPKSCDEYAAMPANGDIVEFAGGQIYPAYHTQISEYPHQMQEYPHQLQDGDTITITVD